ncbi:MAG: hypothetical protein JJE39_13940 [Vicinamibacteria bacterium]|nr:hypothetical protein [Vicinamibacteria bacterium]
MSSLLLLIGPFALLMQAPTAVLKFDAPKEWISKAPSSSMRLADFVLPRVDGDTEDATLTVYFFGAQGGGGVQANLDRFFKSLRVE